MKIAEVGRGNLPPFLEGVPSPLLLEQVALFTRESIYARPTREFDPFNALTQLEKCQGMSVVMVDIGGGKAWAGLGTLNGRNFVIEEKFGPPAEGENGEGYYEYLSKAGEYAAEKGLAVGISCAGLIEGFNLKESKNAEILVEKLAKNHDGDFRGIFPTLKVLDNDAVAGLTSAAIEAAGKDERMESMVYLINGGGVGGAILLYNMIIATEVGHVPAAAGLNIHGQTKPCGMPIFDGKPNQFVCIERVIASGAGIEPLWLLNDPEHRPLKGPQIEALHRLYGNALAGELYENSAFGSAHAIQGMANSYGLDLTSPRVAIVGHGGAFKFDGYGSRVEQFLARHLTVPTARFMTTYEYSPNACADGAAKAALIASIAA